MLGCEALNLSLSPKPITTSLTKGMPSRDTCTHAPPTFTAVPAVPFAQQNRLGVVGSLLSGGSDLAGYPNGRRPKDDVVDISLVAVMGGLCVANGNNNALGFGAACNPSVVPLAANGTVFKLHDAVDQAVVPLMAGFPYLNTPNPGAK